MGIARRQPQDRLAVRTGGHKGWLESLVAGDRERASEPDTTDASHIVRMLPESQRLVRMGERKSVRVLPVTDGRMGASAPGAMRTRCAVLLAVLAPLVFGTPAGAEESTARAASEQFTRIVAARSRAPSHGLGRRGSSSRAREEGGEGSGSSAAAP